jgi:hypothetical protein
MSRPSFVIFAQNYLSALLSNFGTVFLNEPMPRNPKLRVYKHPSRSGWEGEYLKSILGDDNRIRINAEVIGEAELVDVLFEPDPTKSRANLGVLGSLTSVPCIIDTLHSPPESPDSIEILCLIHNWLSWYAEEYGGIVPVDEAPPHIDKKIQPPLPVDSNKAQLIIFPTVQYDDIINGFGGRPSPLNIPGLYTLPPALCNTTFVFTQLLPVDTSTLWLRLLGRGETQRQAIIELVNSDIDNPLYALARQQLRAWYQVLLEDRADEESQELMQSLAVVNGFSE